MDFKYDNVNPFLGSYPVLLPRHGQTAGETADGTQKRARMGKGSPSDKGTSGEENRFLKGEVSEDLLGNSLYFAAFGCARASGRERGDVCALLGPPTHGGRQCGYGIALDGESDGESCLGRFDLLLPWNRHPNLGQGRRYLSILISLVILSES